MVELGWRAQKNATWIEKHCRVPEGMKVGQPIELHPVQLEILHGIYDSPTRQALISFGKKNGKTTLCGALAALHLAGPESRQNSQLYSLGESREQAAVLHGLCWKMISGDPDLSAVVVSRAAPKELVCPERGTLYGALSSEASTAHGKSPVFIVHDELGQVRGPRSDLYTALELSMGAHEDPLSIVISTQAPTDADLLSVLLDDAQKSGDPRIKVFLWTAPEKADPWKEATWKLANPMYGVTLNPEVVRDAAEKARRMPSAEADFRNYVLNQRVNRNNPFISRSVWQACAGAPDPEVLQRGPVFAGLDLSARNDLTAWVMVAFDLRVWHVWAEFFAPAIGVHDRARRDRVPYDVWAREGWLTLTEGATVQYEEVADRIIRHRDDLDIKAIGFDAWRMEQLEKEISRLGVDLKRAPDGPLVPFRQGFQSMAPALDLLEGALVAGNVRHGGNPVLTWCAANAVATKDPAGNRKLDKSKATGRIDGIVALVMAGGVSVAPMNEQGPSVYEGRGLVEI